MAHPTSSSSIPSYPSSFPHGAIPPYAPGTGNNQLSHFYPYAPISNTNTYSSAVGIFPQSNYGTHEGVVPAHMLQELEARWYHHHDAKIKELEGSHRLHMKELEGSHRLYMKELVEESHRDFAALGNQINKTLKIKEILNLRGGLEWIVYQAKKLGKIAKNDVPGIQAGLNEIANTEAFSKVLKKELATRNLLEMDVKRCIAVLYHEASKHAHGNNGKITIYYKDHVENEWAALVTFFKVQSGWKDCLKWEEVPRSAENM
ncbi:hypothetical protein HOY80DRAFT_1053582 [Tuber brumale]|nr:hypothetical protein HOY80DRAFT_1058684 [Tuber brumale]KAG0636710.1 hypothetical protein HOY80DRAFT_1053582 [Tuber brumale]